MIETASACQTSSLWLSCRQSSANETLYHTFPSQDSSAVQPLVSHFHCLIIYCNDARCGSTFIVILCLKQTASYCLESSYTQGKQLLSMQVWFPWSDQAVQIKHATLTGCCPNS